MPFNEHQQKNRSNNNKIDKMYIFLVNVPNIYGNYRGVNN